MPEQDWRCVAEGLRRQVVGPTSEQRELAELLRADLPDETPAPVAAVLLRRLVRGALGLPAPQDIGDGQLEYLGDIAGQTGIRVSTDVESRDLLDAWVSVAHSKRAAEHLERLQPAVGDIVVVVSGGARVTAEVASISRDGRINFRGGGGRGARPHRVQIVARCGEDAYENARYAARQEAATAVRCPENVGPGRLAELRKWAVAGTPGFAALRAFSDALEEANDERPLQAVLQQHPQLLAYLVDGHHAAYVIPQPSLGSEYVPDFFVAGLTSGGLRWTMVELESPTARLTIRDGQPSRQLRKGLQQIADWREWLTKNLDYARRSPHEDGLGLVGIRADAQGLVIVGRGELSEEVDVMRQRVRGDQHIEVRTYDWLVRACSTQRRLPFGMLDYELATAEVEDEADESSYPELGG